MGLFRLRLGCASVLRFTVELDCVVVRDRLEHGGRLFAPNAPVVKVVSADGRVDGLGASTGVHENG